MVNIDDFIKRLELILDYYSLSASGFADKIGVQRSSLSHLLSSRNKPSLDFILKIIEVFPEVDLYWILIGNGNFPKSNNNVDVIIASKKNDPTPVSENKILSNLFSNNDNENLNLEIGQNENEIYQNTSNSNSAKKSNIEKIIIFYLDGSFSEHNPK